MNIIKSLIFYPMLWLRTPVIMLGKIVGGLLFLGAVMVFFMEQDKEGYWTMQLTFVGLSFFFFMLNQFYDHILLKLNPTDSELFLSQ